jgi:hypothetical protein
MNNGAEVEQGVGLSGKGELVCGWSVCVRDPVQESPRDAREKIIIVRRQKRFGSFNGT